MQVNDEKYDICVHDPMFLANKLKRWQDELQYHLVSMSKCVEQVNLFMQELALYRQHLLNAIEIKGGELNEDNTLDRSKPSKYSGTSTGSTESSEGTIDSSD